MSAPSGSRAELVDEYVRRSSLALVLQYLARAMWTDGPAPLALFVDGKLWDKVDNVIEGGMLSKLWPGDDPPDDDPEWSRAQSEQEARTASMFFALAASGPYFLECARHFSELVERREANHA